MTSLWEYASALNTAPCAGIALYVQQKMLLKRKKMALVQPVVIHSGIQCSFSGPVWSLMYLIRVYETLLATIAVLSQRGGVSGPVHVSICKDSLCPRRLALCPIPTAAPRRSCLAQVAARQSLSVEVGYDKQCGVPNKVKLFRVMFQAGMLLLYPAYIGYLLNVLPALQEVQRERRESDIGHSNVVTMGNQRQRNGTSDQSHSVQKQSQQQVYSPDMCSDMGVIACVLYMSIHGWKRHMLQ